MAETRCEVCGHSAPHSAREAQCPNCGRAALADVVMQVPAATGTGSMLAPTVISGAFYARAWYEDALREARDNNSRNHHARRREILFAVCCAESYLYEWAYDLLSQQKLTGSAPYAEIVRYFPSDDKRGVSQRYKDVPKALHADRWLPVRPDLGGSHGTEWLMLVAYRDGLVHAKASRPVVIGPGATHAGQPPAPSLEQLRDLRPGWALQVTAERVRRLHQAAGTAVPGWLGAP